MAPRLTFEVLLEIFEGYNVAIWPMQVVAYGLGVLALAAVVKGTALAGRVVTGILGFFWLWTGVAFFLLYFAPRRPNGYLFGALFILQALLFLSSVLKPRLGFRCSGRVSCVAGLLMVAYAMVGYPVVGLLLGRHYPQAPVFGLTPCPLTAFTFGILLLTTSKVPVPFMIIPFLWAAGGIVPISLGVAEDIGMMASGLLGAVMIIVANQMRQVAR